MRPRPAGARALRLAAAAHALRLVLELPRAQREGGISVRAGWRAPNRGEIEVIDTSPGPTLKEFERLARALDSAADGWDAASTGDGIGLALARRIARVLGGDLEYERAPNARGVYRVRFALEPVAAKSCRGGLAVAARAAAHRARPARRPRAARARWLLRRVLEEIGLEVATAETGLAAPSTAAARQLRPGPARARHARDGRLRRDCRAAPRRLHRAVIALAEPATLELRERSRGFGFDALLLKPIDRMTLLDSSAHVRRRSPHGGGTA